MMQYLRYKGATYELVEAGGFTTMYHIGPRPAKPVLKFPRTVEKKYEKEDLAQNPYLYETGYRRPWLPDRTSGPVVFLSDNPVAIWQYHNRRGNVYAYKVPQWVIEKSGGIHRFDWGREVLIPEELWENVELVGKVSEKKFGKMLDDAGGEFGTWYQDPRQFKKKEPDYEKAQEKLQEHSRWRKLEKRVEKENRRLKNRVDPKELATKFLEFIYSNFGWFVTDFDLPLERDHHYATSLKKLFATWSARKERPYGTTGIAAYQADPLLQALKKSDYPFWNAQVQLIERSLFA